MQTGLLTDIFLPLSLAGIMFGMGMTLTWDDFRRIVVFPKAAVIGLFAQLIGLPLLGWGLIHIIEMEPALAVGLMILALSPGGPTASLITYLSRGDAALSVTFTAVTSIVTLVTTPIGLGIVLALLHRAGATEVRLDPAHTVLTLLVVTVIPISLGMLTRRRSLQTAQALETPFKFLSLLLLFLIILGVIVQNREDFFDFFARAGIAALVLNLAAFGLALGLAVLLRCNKAQSIAIAVDTGNCNGTLAILIATTILQVPEMAVTPAVYSLIMLTFGGVVIFTAPRIETRKLKTHLVTARTVGMMFRDSVRRWGPKAAFMLPGRDGYTELSYDALYDRVHHYADALQRLGLRRGDRLVILSENCPEWAYTDWACSSLGIVTVPIYPTLPPDMAQFIATDAEATVAVCGTRELARKLEGLPGLRVMQLHKGEESLARLAEAPVTLDRATWEREIEATDPEALLTIIYTSGTTGRPKGVLLPHRAFVHVAEEARKLLPIDQRDVFFSFLPMSHVMERIPGQAVPIGIGATIAFSRSLLTLAKDLQAAQPTIMVTVPRFLEATRSRILDNVRKSPWFDRKLIFFALDQGSRRMRRKFAPFARILDLLVLFTIRDRVFGRLRYCVSGGAALAPAVAEFYTSLGVTILQGYGLTETAGGTCINHPNRNRYWTVGEPLGMEMKIAPDGEILFRGPGLMQGYHNLPEATAKAIDAEGWFHTGDIGVIERGNLIITDRKKDLLVLANGKNVAPQPIENALKASDYIAEAVVLGDGRDHCSALIVPDFEAIRSLLQIPEDVEDRELAVREDVVALLKGEVAQVNSTLADFELVKRHLILESPLSADQGELTPTMKVKRKVVSERYGERLFSKSK